ncbi:hypothetical protein AAHC03_024213 [Spirometra sp. Aus1]
MVATAVAPAVMVMLKKLRTPPPGPSVDVWRLRLEMSPANPEAGDEPLNLRLRSWEAGEGVMEYFVGRSSSPGQTNEAEAVKMS